MSDFENYNYNVPLEDDYSHILSQDFWVCQKISGSMLSMMLEPVKMFSSVCIFVKRGNGQASVNLNDVEIKSPCIIHIRPNQYLEKDLLSDDFEASFIVMSKRLVDDIMLNINSMHFYSLSSRYPVIELEENDIEVFEKFYAELSVLVKEKDNPYLYQTLRHYLTAFFYRVAYRYYRRAYENAEVTAATTLADKFMALVEKNFREHRFLEYYAHELEVSPKHLSRTIKKVSGCSAVDWIERFLILEAKMQLRYTNKTVQQIAEQLNFSSQSFFGKYFRKITGMSPKDFRNSGRQTTDVMTED